MTTELRFMEAMPIGVDAKNERRLSGYAVVWNSVSRDLGGFVERFSPSAFSDFLSNGKPDVRAFVNHDPAKIIGRQSAGTLTLTEDSQGLRFSIDVANTTHGNDVLESVRRGDISGMSFGFGVAKNGAKYERLASGPTLRTVEKATLAEISPVTFPAYDASSVLNRCSDDLANELRAFKDECQSIDLETYKKQIELIRLQWEGIKQRIDE